MLLNCLLNLHHLNTQCPNTIMLEQNQGKLMPILPVEHEPSPQEACTTRIYINRRPNLQGGRHKRRIVLCSISQLTWRQKSLSIIRKLWIIITGPPWKSRWLCRLPRSKVSRKRIITFLMTTHHTMISIEGKPLNIKIDLKNSSHHILIDKDLKDLNMMSSQIIGTVSMMILPITIKTK